MDVPELDPGSVKKGPLFHCDHCDKELARKISQLLLFGLATACVDNSTGLFKSPASIAVVTRKEMVDYLKQRSQMHLTEAPIEGDDVNANSLEELSDDPTEIICVFIDDFVSSKRNLFSRVSGWLSSEGREEKIDDFVQEMETNAFWPMDRREAIAATLIRNVELKGTFHCSMKFDSAEELAEHKSQCRFRTINCMNIGCKVKFSALHGEKHDLECPFKIIPCEQMCSESVMRRDMDRHCVTVCSMRLVNCPFFQVGCECAFPQCNLEKHCSEFLQSHLLYVLQVVHKQEASMEELKMRVQLLEKVNIIS